MSNLPILDYIWPRVNIWLTKWFCMIACDQVRSVESCGSLRMLLDIKFSLFIHLNPNHKKWIPNPKYHGHCVFYLKSWDGAVGQNCSWCSRATCHIHVIQPDSCEARLSNFVSSAFPTWGGGCFHICREKIKRLKRHFWYLIPKCNKLI